MGSKSGFENEVFPSADNAEDTVKLEESSLSESPMSNAETATRWLLTVYTNELNWLFCWSYWLIEPCKYVAPDETLGERFSRWWKTVRSAKETERHLSSPVSKRKYFAFYVAQTILALTRLVLNFVGFMLILDSIRNVSPQSKDENVEANLPYQYVCKQIVERAANLL